MTHPCRSWAGAVLEVHSHDGWVSDFPAVKKHSTLTIIKLVDMEQSEMGVGVSYEGKMNLNE